MKCRTHGIRRGEINVIISQQSLRGATLQWLQAPLRWGHRQAAAGRLTKAQACNKLHETIFKMDLSINNEMLVFEHSTIVCFLSDHVLDLGTAGRPFVVEKKSYTL